MERKAEYYVHTINKSHLMVEDFGEERDDSAPKRYRTIRVILDEERMYSTISIAWWPNRNESLLNTMAQPGRKPSDASAFNTALIRVFNKEKRLFTEMGLIQHEPVLAGNDVT